MSKEKLLRILCVLFFITMFKVTGEPILITWQLLLLIVYFFVEFAIFEYEPETAFKINIIILGIMLVVLLVSSKLPYCREGYILDDAPFNDITVCRDGKYNHETIIEYMKEEKYVGDDNKISINFDNFTGIPGL